VQQEILAIQKLSYPVLNADKGDFES